MAPRRHHGLPRRRRELTLRRGIAVSSQYSSPEIIAEGDLVAIRGTAAFENHQEEFMGVPPTGRDATTTGFSFFRVEDGMIVERWGVGDMMSLMQQLGVEMEVPEPEHAQRKFVQ